MALEAPEDKKCDNCKYGDPEFYDFCWNADSPYYCDWAPYDTYDKWEAR